MPLTLPSLDDRRWSDLVEEGRSLLPLYAPGWTDHNLHDPGITLMELFAWIAEMDLFRIDQVPDAHRLRFLALLGIAPEPAAGAWAPIAFRLADAGPPLELPAGLVLEASGAGGEPLEFLIDRAVTVAPGALAAIQSQAGGAFTDLSAAWQRTEPLAPFGDDPAPGDALYLGWSEPPPAGAPLTLHFEVVGGGPDERRRLAARLAEAERCGAPPLCCCEDGRPCLCTDGSPAAPGPAQPPRLAHPSVRLAWETAVAPGVWHTLDAGEVEDETRSLTLSGRVTLRLPASPAAVKVGEVRKPLPTLRCRFATGAYDASPAVTAVLYNAVGARQEAPVGSLAWRVAADAVVAGETPTPGRSLRLYVELDEGGDIRHLIGGADDAPELFVLDWTPPGPEAGELVVEAAALDDGSGRPYQALDLPRLIPAGERLEMVSREQGLWRRWHRRADFDTSTRADADFVVEPAPDDAEAGRPLARIRVGDGEHGRTLPEGAAVWAAYRATAGAAGATGPGSFGGLADTARNRALLAGHPGGFEGVAARLAAVDSPLAATGGSDGEGVDDAARRALDLVARIERAVTLADIEALALATPGVRLARAEARAELHPDLPCYRAPGVVTVLVLPHLPAGRPEPSAGTLAAVAAHLGRRRTLGSRIEVAAPTYVEVRVRAHVMACPGVDPQALVERLEGALGALFHPLTGGPDGTGWPFGRTVYAAEVYQALDETEGADHVLSLELIGADGEARCGNLCLPPTGLVQEGEHELTVEGGSPRC